MAPRPAKWVSLCGLAPVYDERAKESESERKQIYLDIIKNVYI